MTLVDHAAEVGAFLRVITKEGAHGLDDLALKRGLDAFMDIEVIRRDTGLAGVHHLAGNDALDGNVQFRIRVHDGWAFAAKFQRYRCEIAGGFRHDNLADARAAGEEDMVKTLLEQGVGDFRAAREYGDVLRREKFTHHFFKHLRDGRVQRGRLDDDGVAGRDGTHQRLYAQQERVVVGPHDQ